MAREPYVSQVVACCGLGMAQLLKMAPGLGPGVEYLSILDYHDTGEGLATAPRLGEGRWVLEVYHGTGSLGVQMVTLRGKAVQAHQLLTLVTHLCLHKSTEFDLTAHRHTDRQTDTCLLASFPGQPW